MTLSDLADDVPRERRVKVDRDRVGEHAAAVELDPEQLADLAVRAVGADEVLRAQLCAPRRCRRLCTVAVTPSASCSMPTTSVPSITVAPACSARASQNRLEARLA